VSSARIITRDRYGHYSYYYDYYYYYYYYSYYYDYDD